MARQFDVVANPDPEDAVQRPYLLVLQSDLVSELASTVVAPLVAKAAMAGARRLNPSVVVADREFWLATHELFAVHRRVLGASLASLADRRHDIIAALDLLFTGI
jgi:toxin CcdB